VQDLYRELLALLDAGGSAALCTVIHSAGSSPQKVGSKMLVRSDGSLAGTIGGGAIELATIEQAREVLRTSAPRLFKAHLTRDLAMCCGGRMEIFIEAVGTRPWLVVFGGGHVGAAICAVASRAGFRVRVVDEREEFASAAAHPSAERVDCADPRDLLDELPWGSETFAVIVTHSHRVDEDLLERCAGRPCRYLGMIGSRAKVYRFLRRYRARGLDMERFRTVRAPIGLDLHAREPGEIAVAIVAEMIAVRRNAGEGPFAALHVTDRDLPERLAAEEEFGEVPEPTTPTR
jgi:xanthine dehydrogenase accessory factor